MSKEKELLAKGWIRCRVLIELAGKPKEHIEKTIRDYIERIKAEPSIIIVEEDIAEAVNRETGAKDDNMVKELWATFAELEILIENMIMLTNFCISYMPSSVEIIEPEEMKITGHDITKFFNDLQSRLHDLDLAAKQIRSEVMFLRKNINILLKNYVVLLLRKHPLSISQLSVLTGVDKKPLEDFLDRLLDDGELDMEGENYMIKSNVEQT